MRAELAEARRRTLELVATLGPAELDHQFSPLMSPLAWDLGHIAAFEDLWLSRSVPGLRPLRPELWEVYDATETPRAGRSALAFLRSAEAREYLGEVRALALDVLDTVDLTEHGNALNANGFVWHLLIEHEHQHNETMLQALQLAGPDVYRPRRSPLPPGPGPAGPPMVLVEAGLSLMGAGPTGFAYDNERPLHEVELPSFTIDRTPVTNAAFSTWMEDGGYQARAHWSEEGWAWREREGVEGPLFWQPDWRTRRFDRTTGLDPTAPVMHVSWYEADAFARAHGKRLPTEAEWEKAASWDPAAQRKHLHPWGDLPAGPHHANLDSRAFEPASVDAYPAGASPYGALAMLGDVWEWTASEFGGYPGFRAFPYGEYSEIFFGKGFRVLRGGSWATRLPNARATFRNWDYPGRRQLFSGFRCAADA